MTEETLDNLVKCAICLDNYNDPRCLPCSHTFCYSCIEKLCEDGIGQCPMRDNSIFFRHTIDKLPVNRVAKDLLEHLNKSSSTNIKCNHCQKILSEFFCKTCSKYFCEICLKTQHDMNQFSTHQINIILPQNQINHCPEHLEEKQKYWCSICQELVCSDCLLFQHKDHLFLTLQEISSKIKLEFHSAMENLSQLKDNLQQLREKKRKKPIEIILKNIFKRRI